jgi:sugar/nucleoside kinase (ribokinase family)
MPSQRRPVVCVSYLAAAGLWKVSRFPKANHGAEVLAVERSVAADGPMITAVLTALDMPALLVANDVGDDANGVEILGWLRRHEVAATVRMAAGLPTPQIAVVADDQGMRTWFPYLPGVANALGHADLAPLAAASFAYIDCYQLIEEPAVRAIQAARAAGAPLLLNLGGSPLSAAVATVARGHPGLIVQTNVDDAACPNAPAVAADILAATEADWAVVTAGAHGAVAVSPAECLHVPSFRAVIRHTHCAGAAFSGGLLYGLLLGWPMSQSLTLACASGALRCERAHDQPMPTLAELRTFIGSRERTSVPAA